ncbi:MAG: hypothetical protein IIY70_02155 [Oscillospiraceae bacterium]|nr:hypothetical protein [Oscillospiraceae bacterium]
MKYLYLGLLIIALLLGACQISRQQIEARTEAVCAPLTEALQTLQTGDSAAGRRLLERSRAEWKRHEGVFASLMSHSYTREVGNALEELEAVPDQELERLTRHLLRAVRELAQTERPVWRNIF